jgi:predicted neutral ceramidase superfamily lipid hydrolase
MVTLLEIIIRSPQVIINLIIIALSLALLFEVLKRVKESGTKVILPLLIFVAWIAIAYTEQTLTVFLTDLEIVLEGSTQHRLLTGLCFTVGSSIAAACVAIFAIRVLKPKKSGIYSTSVIVVAMAFILLWIFFGEMNLEKVWGVAEWTPSPQLAAIMGLVAAMSFIPPILFFSYGVMSKTPVQKLNGYTLSTGFFILAYFIFVSDNYSTVPPIVIRRICIAIGMFIVYLGFTLPGWYLSLVKRFQFITRSKKASSRSERKEAG